VFVLRNPLRNQIWRQFHLPIARHCSPRNDDRNLGWAGIKQFGRKFSPPFLFKYFIKPFMKSTKFRKDVIDTQLKIAQLQALICAKEESDGSNGEIKSYPAPWRKDSKEVLRVGGRFASAKKAVEQAVGDVAGKAGEQLGNLQKQATAKIDEIKAAGPMGVDIPKALDEAKKKVSAGAGKAIADIASGSYVDAIKKEAEYLSKNVSTALALEVAKIEAVGFAADVAFAADKSGLANLTPGQKIAVGIRRGARDVVDAAKNISADPLIRAANYGKDRIASIKEVVEEEKARKQKGLPPMSAEQQANLASYKFHQKRAADNYSWNPLARNNARFVTEKVSAAKASMGKSPDTVDKLLHDMGMATDKTKQVAESFKKRISEITPENYKEKLQEFAADCNVKPKGDPMTEVAQFLHAGTSILTGVAGVLGPETAIALAAAPIAPALMGELAGGMIVSNAASLAGSGVAMASGWGEDAEKDAGAIAYLAASQLVLSGTIERAIGKISWKGAANLAEKAGRETRRVYDAAKSVLPKKNAAVSFPTRVPRPMKMPPTPQLPPGVQKLLPPAPSPEVKAALKKFGLPADMAKLPPDQLRKKLQEAYAAKVKKAVFKGSGTKSRKPNLGPKKGFGAEVAEHDLNQSFSYLMKAIGF
jgi:hypothetical protein